MRAISLPFRLDGFGRVATSTNREKIWADRARTVVATGQGERVMRPTFGTNLPAELFDSISDLPGFADQEIQSAFVRWLPDLEYEGINEVEETEREGEIQLAISYKIPKVEEDGDTSYVLVID